MALRTQITIRTLNKGEEQQNWFIFESDHEDLYELNESLIEDGTVYGDRLETKPLEGDHRVRVINGRSEFIITKLALVTAIAPAPFELVEAGELPAARR